MRVVLIRHLAPLIEPGICYGRLDLPMHPHGAAAMVKLAADPVLIGATRVWTSPAHRCQLLAETIAGALSAPLTADDRLQELDFGEWEGKAWDDVPRAALDRWAANPLTFAAPGGESGYCLIQRVREFYDALCRDAQRPDGQICVVVSHGGPLKILMALLRQQSVDLLARPPELGAVIAIEAAA